MPTRADHADLYLKSLLADTSAEAIRRRLSAEPEVQPVMFPAGKTIREDQVRKRWEVLRGHTGVDSEALLDARVLAESRAYEANIENFVGTLRIPVGLAGPLQVNGLHAKGSFYLPMATTEAALVASYHRGCLAITEAGGCRSVLLNRGVSRAPVFVFSDLVEAGQFAAWVLPIKPLLAEMVGEVTRYGRLKDMLITIEGNHVFLNFDYETADASGQNMVTLATDHLCQYINRNTPVIPRRFFIEGNLSGDKKASMQSFQHVRGRKVSSEVVIPAQLVKRRLRTDSAAMVDYWKVSSMGSVMSGCFGIQGHFANGLAALYIACGQDAACVAESAVGITRMEMREGGDLYATVTLPNLMLGTVGGGTGLPGPSCCLDIIGVRGPGNADRFAEVACALILAGELSIVAALSAGHFSQAHRKLARDRKQASPSADARDRAGSSELTT